MQIDNFDVYIPLFQVKSTYWRAVKAWHSHTVGSSTSWWILKGTRNIGAMFLSWG